MYPIQQIYISCKKLRRSIQEILYWQFGNAEAISCVREPESLINILYSRLVFAFAEVPPDMYETPVPGWD